VNAAHDAMMDTLNNGKTITESFSHDIVTKNVVINLGENARNTPAI
jgi:hypothetical protein